MRRIDAYFAQFARFLEGWNPWNNVYAVARTLIATCTLITLLFNSSEIMFRTTTTSLLGVKCEGFASISIYCMVGVQYLEVARWISILILVLVLVGVYPRYTAVLHWWAAFSLFASSAIVDGGEVVANNFTLLLLPLAVFDPRRNHWEGFDAYVPPRISAKVFAYAAICAIRFQTSFLYFQAGEKKMLIQEWVDGTAMYYWLNSPYIGLPNYLKPLFEGLLLSPVVALLTWSVIVFEIGMAYALFLNKERWWPLLAAGLVFHFLIAWLMGIVSFGIAMMGVVILYLRPLERPFNSSAKSTPVRANSRDTPAPHEQL